MINMVVIVQLYSQVYSDKKGNLHLWGEVRLSDLTDGEYGEWYAKNADEYESTLTSKEGKLLKDCDVTIYLGTWCGDTKYLVPKFVKAWQSMGLSEEQLSFVALHNEGDNYKQGPDRETIGKNIHRVPTFVFEKDGEEVERIVERTVFDLDTDIMQIAMGNPYEERYQAVAILDRIMNEMDIDSLYTSDNFNKVYRKVRREVSTSSELNTFGYVLKAQGEIDKAEFVFLMNRYLFPYEPNVRDSYGEILAHQEKWDAAIQEYEEVIRLKGSDENAVRQLNTIYTELEKKDIEETK